MARISATVDSWTRAAACGVSITVLAWFSAGVVLRFVTPEMEVADTILRASAARVIQGSPGKAGLRKQFFPIFGEAAVNRPTDRVPVVRDTAYSLRGVFRGTAGRGFAMVESSGVTAVYRERDRLPGGETIAEINRDSVLLNGARGLVALAFEHSGSTGAADGRPALATPRTGPDVGRPLYEAPPVTKREQGLPISHTKREQRLPISHAMLKKHVLSTDALSAVRFKRVRAYNGKMGLRVQWLRQDDLTDMLGLRPGDVILTVNGLSTDDPKTMGTLVKMLPVSREVVIDLERGRGSHQLVIPLSQG